jgi:PleD family two-component response regulator
MSAPLILAIHPDRRQAPKIASIARHASAELLLAESMERAIAMLSDRLPDLILTPTLLSHRDETALGERLRELLASLHGAPVCLVDDRQL